MKCFLSSLHRQQSGNWTLLTGRHRHKRCPIAQKFILQLMAQRGPMGERLHTFQLWNKMQFPNWKYSLALNQKGTIRIAKKYCMGFRKICIRNGGLDRLLWVNEFSLLLLQTLTRYKKFMKWLSGYVTWKDVPDSSYFKGEKYSEFQSEFVLVYLAPLCSCVGIVL